MAARRATTQEFLPNDAETRAQIEAGRVLMMQTEEPEEDPNDVALANIMADLGADATSATVKVYQLNDKRELIYAATYLPAEFTEDKVRDQFGSGSYMVHVRVNNKIRTRKILNIAPYLGAAPALAPSGATASVETRQLAETMQNGFKELSVLFLQGIQAIAANQPKPKSTEDFLREMSLMKQIFHTDPPPAPAPGPDPLAMVEMALHLSEKITPRQGEPSAGEIILEAVKSFAPTINEMIGQRQAQEIGPDIEGPAPMPLPAPVQPFAAPSPAPTQENQNVDITTRIYVNTLLAAAANGADPDTYANNILDLLPDEKVLEFVNKPNWFDEVGKSVPAAIPHKVWFEELKARIIDLTSEEIEPSVDEAKPVPMAPNATQ